MTVAWHDPFIGHLQKGYVNNIIMVLLGHLIGFHVDKTAPCMDKTDKATTYMKKAVKWIYKAAWRRDKAAMWIFAVEVAEKIEH